MAGDSATSESYKSSYASTRARAPPLSAFAAVPPLSIFRLSPLVCINQDLVDELEIIRRARKMLHGSQVHETMSYAQAVSTIIGCPHRITTVEQARQLPHVSDKKDGKIASKIEEFLKHGEIQEAREYQKDEKLRCISDFQKIHGIGHETASRLYKDGARTLDDLRQTGDWQVPFKYFDDLQQKVSRSDVESCCGFIKLQLDRIEPGAHLVIGGGYRRGKEWSGDIDIIITYPHEEGKERGILRKLLKKLQRIGLIPPDGILSEQNCATDRITVDNLPASSLDSLDKALIIFRHPANSTTRPTDTWRRVDLVFTAWSSYGAAIVGWTGSTQFERDLRRHAEIHKMRFDSGGLRMAHNSEVVPTQSEEDVFMVLGIPWLSPEMRNADP